MAENTSRIQAFKDEMRSLFEKYQVEMEVETSDCVEVEMDVETSNYVKGIVFYMGGEIYQTVPFEDFKLYGRTFIASDFK
jgi:hypothetical protein